MRNLNCITMLLLVGMIISACGSSQAELEGAETQMEVEASATQPAQAPAGTNTNTPIPSATITPTTLPNPSPTVDIAARETELVKEVAALLEDEDIEGAIELCSEAIEADPTFAMAYLLRGVNLIGNLDFKAAVEDFDQAIELGIAEDLDKEIEPGVTVKTIYYFRGLAHMARSETPQGLEDLEQFLDLTEPSEYPDLRMSAQELAGLQPEAASVSDEQPFEFQLFSWHLKVRGGK
jgi:tetratricopeptide (TPR) repeat protein